jgi:hypothetical protein
LLKIDPGSPRGSRSGSLALTRPLLDLGRHRLVLEGFRGLRAAVIPRDRDAWASVALRSRSELSGLPGLDRNPTFLSWDSSRWGIAACTVRVCPFIDMASRSPLPLGLAASLRHRGSHPRCMFRPRGFSPPRRFPPPEACGLVASRYRSWGSSRFRGSSPRFIEIRRPLAEPLVPFPATLVFVPFEECPRLQPYRVTTAFASRVFPRRLHSERHLRGVAPESSRKRPNAVASDAAPLPSWACFPFKVLATPQVHGRTPKRSSVARSLWEFAVSTGRSLSSCAPGVCPEPKFVSPKRHRPSWGS